jgi:hypothetical protein
MALDRRGGVIAVYKVLVQKNRQLSCSQKTVGGKCRNRAYSACLDDHRFGRFRKLGQGRDRFASVPLPLHSRALSVPRQR